LRISTSLAVSSCRCNQGYTGVDGECVSCPAGKYKAEKGSSSCLQCPNGTYSSLASSSIRLCLACPAGSTAPQGSSVQTSCLCEEGFSGPDGGDCHMCESGKYKEALGSASCQACPAGKTSPPGSVSSALCALSCASGSFGPDGGPCENCPGLLLACVCLCVCARAHPLSLSISSPYLIPIWCIRPEPYLNPTELPSLSISPRAHAHTHSGKIQSKSWDFTVHRILSCEHTVRARGYVGHGLPLQCGKRALCAQPEPKP
jgi:hypothetical protein